jgi:hypothetical protein
MSAGSVSLGSRGKFSHPRVDTIRFGELRKKRRGGFLCSAVENDVAI